MILKRQCCSVMLLMWVGCLVFVFVVVVVGCYAYTYANTWTYTLNTYINVKVYLLFSREWRIMLKRGCCSVMLPVWNSSKGKASEETLSKVIKNLWTSTFFLAASSFLLFIAFWMISMSVSIVLWNSYVYVYVYIYMYMYMYIVFERSFFCHLLHCQLFIASAPIHTYIYIYIHTYIHTYTHIYTYIHTCIHIFIHIDTYYTRTYIYTYIHTYIQLHIEPIYNLFLLEL